MILGFKKQFEPLIKSGSKIHTIREDKKGRWLPGKAIHMATGVRTRNYKCFKVELCKSVQCIQIHYFEGYNGVERMIVIIDGKVLSGESVEKLAVNDGFKDTEDFFKWFDKDFHGKIIHWTDFKY